MPEHREGTPEPYRSLESFLWHDLTPEGHWWSAWLSHRGIDAGAASAESAAALHTALRTLQSINADLPGDARIASASLNALVVALGLRPDVEATGSVRLASARADDAVATLLATSLEAMQAGDWHRFKLCRDPQCRASYFDTSKAAGKIWCEMSTCGSRNKMRRRRARDQERDP